MRFTLTIPVALLVIGVAGAAAAAELPVTNETSVEEIDQRLFPAEAVAAKEECVQLTAKGIKCASIIPTRAAAKVTFRRGSARLSQPGLALVRKFGEVLSRRKGLYSIIVIEGHTDATGTVSVNRKLSQQRAETVRRELLASYGLEPASVKAVGKAAESLLDRKDPGAEINRRIEFGVTW
ncbi:MAG: OmpA family protein [Burkholderiales bacterium]